MATLAESFLADLEELDDEGEYEAEDAGAAAAPAGIGLADALNYDDLDSVAPLVHSERYSSILQVRPPTWRAWRRSPKSLRRAARRRGASKGRPTARAHGACRRRPRVQGAQRQPAATLVALTRAFAFAQLIVDCNALTVDIDNEVVLVHNFIRDKCVRRRGVAARA